MLLPDDVDPMDVTHGYCDECAERLYPGITHEMEDGSREAMARGEGE